MLKCILLQEVPDELVLMAERYAKHKREKEMCNPRGAQGLTWILY